MALTTSQSAAMTSYSWSVTWEERGFGWKNLLALKCPCTSRDFYWVQRNLRPKQLMGLNFKLTTITKRETTRREWKQNKRTV